MQSVSPLLLFTFLGTFLFLPAVWWFAFVLQRSDLTLSTKKVAVHCFLIGVLSNIFFTLVLWIQHSTNSLFLTELFTQRILFFKSLLFVAVLFFVRRIICLHWQMEKVPQQQKSRIKSILLIFLSTAVGFVAVGNIVHSASIFDEKALDSMLLFSFFGQSMVLYLGYALFAALFAIFVTKQLLQSIGEKNPSFCGTYVHFCKYSERFCHMLHADTAPIQKPTSPQKTFWKALILVATAHAIFNILLTLEMGDISFAFTVPILITLLFAWFLRQLHSYH